MRAFTPEPTRSSSRSLGKEKALRAQLLKTLGPPLSPKSQEVADATAAANKKKAEDQSRNKNAKAEHAEYTTIEEEMDQRQRDKQQRLQELEGEAIAALAALRNAGGKLDIIKRSEAKRIVESSKTQKSRSPRRKSKDRRRRR
jgi:hypothetical protein